MLSEDEKEAIKKVEEIKNIKFIITSSFYSRGAISLSIVEKEAIDTVLNLIIKQSNILNKIEEYAKGMNDKELLLILKSNEIDELINSCKKGGLLNE